MADPVTILSIIPITWELVHMVYRLITTLRDSAKYNASAKQQIKRVSHQLHSASISIEVSVKHLRAWSEQNLHSAVLKRTTQKSLLRPFISQATRLKRDVEKTQKNLKAARSKAWKYHAASLVAISAEMQAIVEQLELIVQAAMFESLSALLAEM